jgi:hypothetical protein
MTGAKYLRLVWTSWCGAVVCTIIIAVAISPTRAIVPGFFLALWAWANVTAGRRAAARIDARHH